MFFGKYRIAKHADELTKPEVALKLKRSPMNIIRKGILRNAKVADIIESGRLAPTMGEIGIVEERYDELWYLEDNYPVQWVTGVPYPDYKTKAEQFRIVKFRCGSDHIIPKKLGKGHSQMGKVDIRSSFVEKKLELKYSSKLGEKTDKHIRIKGADITDFETEAYLNALQKIYYEQSMKENQKSTTASNFGNKIAQSSKQLLRRLSKEAINRITKKKFKDIRISKGKSKESEKEGLTSMETETKRKGEYGMKFLLQKPESRKTKKNKEWWDKGSFESFPEEELELLPPSQIQLYIERNKLEYEKKIEEQQKIGKKKKQTEEINNLFDSKPDSDEDSDSEIIGEKEAVFDAPLSPIHIHGRYAEKFFNEPFKLMDFNSNLFPKIRNTGFTIVLKYADLPKRPKVKGGGLSHSEYDVYSITFHWDSSHIINSHRYVLECQIQLIASEYHHQIKVAAIYKGLACLITLFKFSNEDNEDLELLMNSINEIKYTPNVLFSTTQYPVKILDLLPKNIESYYRYEGTFHYPKKKFGLNDKDLKYYRNTVTVFSDKVGITRKQLGAITDLYDEDRNLIAFNNEPTVSVDKRELPLFYQETRKPKTCIHQI